MATVMKSYVTHILYVCTVVFWVTARGYQQSASSQQLLTVMRSQISMCNLQDSNHSTHETASCS
jgi:hypothetical protein